MSKQSKILSKYFELCPSFFGIINKFKPHIIDYDHIATRTFNINQSHKIISRNYKLENDKFFFPQHNANAVWYSNPKMIIPRIFVSTYSNPLFDANLYPNLHPLVSRLINYPSEKMSYYLYHQLQKTNQYLAWTLLFKNDINHIALRVQSAEEFLELLRKCNYPIHQPENPLQISNDKKLIQFSTVADKIKYQFSDGTYEIPYAFVEIIERKVDPITGQIREGFDTENANQILYTTKK